MATEEGAAAGPQRVRFLDAARGSAMLFVLVSHFGFSFFPDQNEAIPDRMRLIGMVASPTFVLVSGILLGFLHRMHRQDFSRLRIKFVDRGLFLITIGHLLILGSHAPAYTRSFWCLSDTIGVCMIVQPWLLERLGTVNRVLVGFATYVVSWLLVLSWLPHPHGLNVLKETFVGSLHPTVYRYEFPILPWFGVALASSAMGDILARLHQAGDRRGMRRFMAWAVASTLTAAVALRGSFALAHREFPHALFFRKFLVFFNPVQKQPPSPEYLLAYGAAGLALLYVWLTIEHRGSVPALTLRAAALGQVSLFVFLLQWYVYFVGFYPLSGRLPLHWAWPLYFVASAVVILGSSRWWHRHGWNRFLTVGFSYAADLRALAVREPRAIGHL